MNSQGYDPCKDLVKAVDLYGDLDVLYGVDVARDRALPFILSKGGRVFVSSKLGLDAMSLKLTLSQSVCSLLWKLYIDCITQTCDGGREPTVYGPL